jgi:hypothetical protein
MGSFVLGLLKFCSPQRRFDLRFEEALNGAIPKPLEVFSSGSILFLPTKPWPGMQALSQITNTFEVDNSSRLYGAETTVISKGCHSLWQDMSREQLGNLTLAFRCCVCSYFFRT